MSAAPLYSVYHLSRLLSWPCKNLVSVAWSGSIKKGLSFSGKPGAVYSLLPVTATAFTLTLSSPLSSHLTPTLSPRTSHRPLPHNHLASHRFHHPRASQIRSARPFIRYRVSTTRGYRPARAAVCFERPSGALPPDRCPPGALLADA